VFNRFWTNDPLVFEFLLHRADEYVSVSHSWASFQNYTQCLPHIARTLHPSGGVPANSILPAPVALWPMPSTNLFLPPASVLKLAAVSGRRRGGTAMSEAAVPEPATPSSRRKQTRLRFSLSVRRRARVTGLWNARWSGTLNPKDFAFKDEQIAFESLFRRRDWRRLALLRLKTFGVIDARTA